MTVKPLAGPERDVRTGMSVAELSQAIVDNLYCLQARHKALATPNDWYMALAYTVRDRLLDRWIRTLERLDDQDVRIVAYLSAEFLIGPQLGKNLLALGMHDSVRRALAPHGQVLEVLLAREEEPGLGNGGLGRLAACFVDSMATLQVPAIGYGIRYEFGIFDQEIREGHQVEIADKWLRFGNPWEVARPEMRVNVPLGGRTESWTDPDGRYRVRWIPDRLVHGIAHDTPIVGYHCDSVNLLRLWSAQAAETFDFQAFNVGDYFRAVESRVASETISKVLYPNDDPPQGKRLRLEQQFFFVSCSLQDMLRLHRLTGGTPATLDTKFAAQLNDTHPSIAVAELMRILVDEHLLDWDRAWEVTTRALSYTNHTLLPEALETWSVPLFGSVLPRHLEIVREIDSRFLDGMRARFPGDEDRAQRMAIVDRFGEGRVRMAHLATVGSSAVNGVAELHSALLRSDLLRDFHELWPEKFKNVTNGVDPRRFVALANPGLADLITETVGDRWLIDPEKLLPGLEPFTDDAGFRARWRKIRLANKTALAGLLRERTGVEVDPHSLFDVQVKRIHEYKRQHLNVLHVVALYHRLKRGAVARPVPRTVIFGGKAAPGYDLAKRIIRLIHGVAAVVNADPAVAGFLRVAFFPDFNVKNAQPIYPAAELSEQISTAGKEASGTGNMKFALNGALTIGTLDGANVEIRDAVGPENFFLFGLDAPGVARVRAEGYDPRRRYDEDAELREVLDAIGSGTFSGGDADAFRPIVDSLLDRDPFMVLEDFRAYVECQDRVAKAYCDPESWTRMSILNTARSGRFSSDRSIRDYCERIWNVRPGTGCPRHP